MKLGLTLILVMLSLSVAARKPAVEDFVGIESETPDTTPSGTESLFNFSSEVKEFQKGRPQQPVVRYAQQQAPLAPATPSTSMALWLGIFFVLGLPMLTWAVMATHLKKREQALAGTGLDNVTDLAAKRAEKQAQTNSDDIKKAS